MCLMTLLKEVPISKMHAMDALAAHLKQLMAARNSEL